MVPTDKQNQVAAFLKTAFKIDGEVTFLSTGETEQLLKSHALSVMMMEDSKRGKFHIATLQRRTSTKQPSSTTVDTGPATDEPKVSAENGENLVTS